MAKKKPEFDCMDCRGDKRPGKIFIESIKEWRDCRTCKGTGKVDRN